MNVAHLVFLALGLSLFAQPVAACDNPAGAPGDIRFNADHDVFQGCTARGWAGFHAFGLPPTGCDTIGDTCSDGTIYAGLSPDGNTAMYVPVADAPNSKTWGPDATDTAMADCIWPYTGGTCDTGKANTTLLAGLGATYEAATYCDGLVAHGHSDWYLPARNELPLLYDLKVAGKGNFQNASYWSSSERDPDLAAYHGFAAGDQHGDDKTVSRLVRCVRQ